VRESNECLGIANCYGCKMKSVRTEHDSRSGVGGRLWSSLSYVADGDVVWRRWLQQKKSEAKGVRLRGQILDTGRLPEFNTNLQMELLPAQG
jgi:hypothetical protein